MWGDPFQIDTHDAAIFLKVLDTRGSEPAQAAAWHGPCTRQCLHFLVLQGRNHQWHFANEEMGGQKACLLPSQSWFFRSCHLMRASGCQGEGWGPPPGICLLIYSVFHWTHQCPSVPGTLAGVGDTVANETLFLRSSLPAADHGFPKG